MIPNKATSRRSLVSSTLTTPSPRSTRASCAESSPMLCRRNRTSWAGACPCTGGAAIAPRRVTTRRDLVMASLHADPVPPRLLGAVQGLIGRLHDLIGRRVAVILLRHADAHRDDDRFARLPPLGGGWLVARPEAPPHRERARLHGFPQLLQVRQALLGALAGKNQREFLAAVAVGRRTPGGVRQPGRDEAQHVVAGVVSVLVVEPLEVIHIDHRDGELAAEPR